MAEKEYIERSEVMKKFSDHLPIGRSIRDSIAEISTADVVEVRHGEWIEGAEHFTNGLYEAECSECNNYIRWNEGNSGDWNYCPNCGAKMDGERKEQK